MEDLDYDSPCSYVEREKLEESLDSLAPEEPIELVERSLNEPHTKRIYAFMWKQRSSLTVIPTPHMQKGINTIYIK